jgi:hypothetical protein
MRIPERDKETLWAVIRFQAMLSFSQRSVQLRDSHRTGVTRPKRFLFMSKITVRVLGWPSQRLSKWKASKPSRLPGQRSENRFPLNSAKIAGKSETVSESKVTGLICCRNVSDSHLHSGDCINA